MNAPLLVAIDVGTTKTITLIAQVSPDAGLELLGLGSHPSTGLRKGLVVDQGRTIQSIRESVALAERAAGEPVRRALVGITGSHLRTHPESAEVTVANPDKGVAANDLRRLEELVRAREFGADRRLVASLVQAYRLDGEPGIQHPLGRSGHRLKVDALLISGDTLALDTLVHSVQEAGVEVAELYLQPVASGEAVLDPVERDKGCVLIDIGGGTSDLAIYYNGVPVYSGVISVGGDHFDSDLAYAFDLNTEQAEWVKVQHATVAKSALDSEDVIRLPWSPTRTGVIASKLVPEVILPRAQELIELIRRDLARTHLLPHLRGGVVLTGGGSQLTGLTTLVSEALEMPTRIGHPTGLIGRNNELRNPSLATGVGLLRLGEKALAAQAEQQVTTPAHNPLANGLLGFLRSKLQALVDFVRTD